jgi:PAS domain S-box-containing protein
MKRRGLLRRVLAGLGWMLLPPGLLPASAAGAEPSTDMIVLQLPFIHGFQFAGYYAAQANGYFEEEGLSVALRPAAAGVDAVDEVLAGRARYGVGGSEVLLERLRGKPLVLVTPIYQHSAFGLLVPAASPVRVPADLRGMRVALPDNPRYAEVWTMLVNAGLRRETLELVPEAWFVDELGSGRADAAAVFFANRRGLASGTGAFRVLRPVDYGFDFYGDGLFTTEDEAKQNPERVQAMRRAVVRGWSEALEDPRVAIDYLLSLEETDVQPLPLARLQEEAEAVRELVDLALVELGHVNRARWAAIARQLVRAGLAESTARLEGFLPAASAFEGRDLRWLRWLAWLVAAGAAIAVGVFAWNLHLQRLVELRTRELQGSERRARDAFDQMPLAILEKDFTEVIAAVDLWRRSGVTDLRAHLDAHPDLARETYLSIRVTGGNARLLRVFGAADLPSLEEAVRRLWSKEVEAVMREELLAVWENRRSVVRELRLPAADGGEFHGLMQWTVIEAPDGSADWSRIVVAISDITDLRRTQERLRRSEARWELAVRGLQLGIWEHDFETGATYFSDRWKEILGYASDEIRGDRAEFWSRVHPDDLVQARQTVEGLSASGPHHYSMEVRLRAKDGGYRWVLSRGQLVTDAAGRARQIVGSHTDISMRKAAEEALRSSEERYRRLFEGSPGPMWLYDAESLRFLEVNAAMERTYGYSRAELLSMTMLDLRPPEDRVRSGGAPIDTPQDVSRLWSHRRKDGSTLYVVITAHAHAFAGQSAVLVIAQDVTERHLAEERVRVSETRYRALFESAVEGVYEARADGTLRAVNPALARMLGHASPAELIERVNSEVGGVYVKPGRRRDFFEALGANETLTDFESEVRCADGTHKWISENVRAIRDSAGVLLYVQGFISDVTERRRSEQAVRRSEERYRVLFEYSPVAILEYDYREIGAWIERLRAEGIEDFERLMLEKPLELSNALGSVALVGMNEAVLDLVGATSKQEVMGYADRIFTEEARLARQRALSAVWHGMNQIEGEFTLMALDGTPRLVFYRWWLPLRDGRPDFEWTQLVLVDLTTTRQAEAALATERERLSVTLRAMAEGVLTTDPQGVIQFINQAAEGLVGWRYGGAVGHPITEVVVLRHRTSRAEIKVPVAASLAQQRVVELPLETMLLNAGGGTHLVEGRCAPLFGVQGQPIGAVMVLRDIGERARMESEMLRASKLESVGILAGGIAHDFNNILTVVMGNLTLAQLDPKVRATAGKWLQEAERAAMRAKDLTQQLLTFAKGGDPVRTAVRLQEIVRESATFALHGSKVGCEFDIDPQLWPADADKGQIGQVVQNLVINAVQAMPDGGRIQIEMRNSEQPPALAASPDGPRRHVWLRISDSGQGIPPEHLGRIFDPYFTTKQSGSGLGLATVYSIVRKHQGHIEVESEIGRGTTFRIWLPAARTPAASETSSGVLPDRMAGRVLFMDDEETIRRMAQALLARLGFEVVAVGDGAEAVSAYRDSINAGRKFDVVVMDLTVPGGMGGRQAMEELLQIDPAVKAVVSSGYSSDPVLANHHAHGFRGVVAKPYRLADLAKVMREVIAEG